MLKPDYINIRTLDEFTGFVLNKELVEKLDPIAVIRYVMDFQNHNDTYLKQRREREIIGKATLDDIDFLIRGGELIINGKHYVIADLGYDNLTSLLLRLFVS